MCRGVAVIYVSKVKGVSLFGNKVSQSYRFKVGSRCFSDISVNGKLRVSVISLKTVF